MPPSSKARTSGVRKAAPGRAARAAQQRRQGATTEAGVSALLGKPDVMAAVMQVLGQKPNPEAGACSASEPAPAEPAPAPTEAASSDAVTQEAVMDASQGWSVMDASQGWYRGSAPPIRAMRKAGYLGNEEELKNIWAWARSNDPHSSVWPTPISGVQEAVRFDTAGWPSEKSSCEEWITCVTFWTALREQLVGGASRSQRRAVTNQFAQFQGQ